jgi:hypothetical protein
MCTVPLREAARLGLQLRITLPYLDPWTVRLGTDWPGAVSDTQVHASVYNRFAWQRESLGDVAGNRARAAASLICRGSSEVFSGSSTGAQYENGRSPVDGVYQYVVQLGLSKKDGAGAGAGAAADTTTVTVVVKNVGDLSAGRVLSAGDRLIVTGTQCEVTIIDPNEPAAGAAVKG